MKNLALAFCSLRPVQLPKEVCDARENEYLICLKQLLRVLPESFDLLVCENTIDNPEQIKNQELKDFLSEMEMCAIGSEGNIGTTNKGMGELLMLKTALEETNLDNYKNVSYITARRFFTCPYVFERTESLEKQALLSNPDFSFLNGKFGETYKDGLYNDMFFSMKTSVMVDYANYTIKYIEENPNPSLGSEQLLYNFVNENKIEYEWLKWLGIIRNDWERTKTILDINNFHTC
jgi:hypothetical protein